MNKLIALVSAATIAWFISTSGSAMPLGGQSLSVMNADGSVENVRLICDEFGRCWRAERDYLYAPGYRYGSAYSEYGYSPRFRPPSKWEQKGFCPPGQRKKGNC